jgi:hypothetical protein
MLVPRPTTDLLSGDLRWSFQGRNLICDLVYRLSGHFNSQKREVYQIFKILRFGFKIRLYGLLDRLSVQMRIDRDTIESR